MNTPNTPSAKRVLMVLNTADVPLSGMEISKLAHVSFSTFKNRAMPALCIAGLIHQSGWQKYAYGHKPTYSKGQGKTPPRPNTLNSSERSQEWRYNTAIAEFNRANRRLAIPDPITAALMGLMK